jgi:hypothetical protein
MVRKNKHCHAQAGQTPTFFVIPSEARNLSMV